MAPDADKLRKRHNGGSSIVLSEEEEGSTVLATNDTVVKKKLEELNGNEICIDGFIYDISNFNHPGGDQMKIFGGNDVTVQYKMIHPYHTTKHLEKMKLVGKVSNFESEYEFDTEFERDVKREVFKIVHRGKEFATPGYIFRCVMYITLFFYLQYMWIFTGSSYTLAVIYGISQALIGLNVQHDANHGAISKKYPIINDMLGLGADLIGYTKWLWIEQHWTHHAYTNHPLKDPDGKGAEPYLLFNDYPKDHPIRQWYHKYQAYLFLPAFSQYASTVWFNLSDLTKLNHSGAVEAGMKFNNNFVKNRVLYAVPLRILYFYINIVMPFQQHGLSWEALGHIVTMGVFGSLFLAIPFSVSHNFENSDRDPLVEYKQSNGKKKVDWFKAQVETSSTYGGAMAGYITGGLNFQIEHHLFPRMSSSWYPYIAPVVRDVCDKHNVKYSYYPSLVSNLISTIKFIHKQGQ